jgi:ribosomal protein S18 acetylase RimI-like enzyme
VENHWRPYVAVSGLIWRGNEVLFLHRVQPPILWVPPGGRVEAGEEPLGALRREIREETSLTDIEIVAPCIVEGGQHEGRDILFVDYVCRYISGDIRLDEREHDDWRWIDAAGRLALAEVEQHMAAGGEPYFLYRWPDQREKLALSHSPEHLRVGRLILDCLRPEERPAVVIRPARETDGPSLARNLYPPAEREAALAHLSFCLSHPNIERLLAVADDEVVGSAELSTNGAVGEIGGLVVHPFYRKRGIGRRLIEALLASARRRGLERVEIGVSPRETWLIAFYRRLGFAPARETRLPLAFGGDEVIYMAMKL